MPKRIICPKCEYIGIAAKKKRGSGQLALFGWAVFPLGVPYSIWRMFGKTLVCKACGHSPVIDEESVVGQRMIDKIYGLEGVPQNIDIPHPIIKYSTPSSLEKPLAAPIQKRDKSIPRPEDNRTQF